MGLDNLTEKNMVVPILKKRDHSSGKWRCDSDKLKELVSNLSHGILETGCRVYASLIKGWIQGNFVNYEAEVIEKVDSSNIKYLVYFCKR